MKGLKEDESVESGAMKRHVCSERSSNRKLRVFIEWYEGRRIDGAVIACGLLEYLNHLQLVAETRK